MSFEQRLARAFLQEHPLEAAIALERLPVERYVAVVQEAPAAAAAALSLMLPSAIAECLSRLPVDAAGSVLDHLSLDAAIAALRRAPDEVADRVLTVLPEAKQELLRRVLRYPAGTAGALMDPRASALPDGISVAEARLRLRRDARKTLHYVFVVDRSGVLVGICDTSELMRGRARDPLRSVVQARFEHVPAWLPASAVRTHPGWQSVHVLPVTDDSGRLVGAIGYETLRRLEQEARADRGQLPTVVTVGALGELFHLGLAGLIEGVATAAAPRRGLHAVDAKGGVR